MKTNPNHPLPRRARTMKAARIVTEAKEEERIRIFFNQTLRVPDARYGRKAMAYNPVFALVTEEGSNNETYVASTYTTSFFFCSSN